jgi:hypothetical protein
MFDRRTKPFLSCNFDVENSVGIFYRNDLSYKDLTMVTDHPDREVVE